MFGFKWVNSINQRIIALIMAPAMTVIAWTIAGNLGLSLGMIGALSIVRFRTPVKSSLELIIYFIHIVIGISITVARQVVLEQTSIEGERPVYAWEPAAYGLLSTSRVAWEPLSAASLSILLSTIL
jgi:hypothetical protein